MTYTSVTAGSVTSPAGFRAAGVAAGLKSNGMPDVALLLSDGPATACGAFTANAFAAAPVVYDRRIIAGARPIRAIVANSGNANACTGAKGVSDVEALVRHVAQLLDMSTGDTLVSSTGRIGVHLDMPRLLAGVDKAGRVLARAGGLQAARAIMTTDTRPKSCAVTLPVNGERVTIGGMAKGAGMIAPNMRPVGGRHATMLAYMTTDAVVSRDFLNACLGQAADASFNRITVDGDTSTNDSFIVLANGFAGNEILTTRHPDAEAFAAAFTCVAKHLAEAIVRDGEGMTRFVIVRVTGAKDDAEARMCAETVANSPLCKTAWCGGDPNWGRVLAAAGRAGVDINPEAASLDYNGVPILRNGQDAGTPESAQRQAVSGENIELKLDLGAGNSEYSVWTCDLTHAYITINAEYHT